MYDSRSHGPSLALVLLVRLVTVVFCNVRFHHWADRNN